MAELRCSIRECSKEIVGAAVLLKDLWEVGMFEHQELFDAYVLMQGDGTYTHTVILHPTCFVDLFNEVMRQEGQTGVTLVVGPAGVIREELGI